MADNQGQPDPTASTSSPAPAEPQATTPEVTTADAGSSTTTQPTNPAPEATSAVDFSRVDGDAYRALRDQMLSQPEPEPQGKPATEPQATAQDKTATEPTPPADENQISEPPATEAEPTESDDTPPIVPPKDYRPRLDALPDVEKEAIQLRRTLKQQGKDVSLAECIRRTEAKYADVPPPGDPQQTTQQTQQLPDTQAIEDKIADLKRQQKGAAKEADTEKMMDLTEAIETGQEALRNAVNQHEQAHRQELVTRDRALKDSKAKAHQLYPALKQPDSPLVKAWNEVYSALQANNDPLLNGTNTDAPLVITQMAAARIGMAPASTTKAPTKATPPTQQNSTTQSRPVQPAPGSAKSTAPANATGQLASKLDSVKTPDDYEALKEQYLREVVA